MQTKNYQELYFVGRPYQPNTMDENGSYQMAYQEMLTDPSFQEFQAEHAAADNLASLIVFGPENYLYWQGMILTADVEVPKGLFKYQLPESKVAEIIKPGNVSIFSQPLNFTVPVLLEDAKKAGIELPANLGLGQNPYVLNILRGTEVTSAIYLGTATADVND